jgi:hypothetical protein
MKVGYMDHELERSPVSWKIHRARFETGHGVCPVQTDDAGAIDEISIGIHPPGSTGIYESKRETFFCRVEQHS